MIQVRRVPNKGRGSIAGLCGWLLAAALLAASCGDDGSTGADTASPGTDPGQSDRESSADAASEQQQFPDVVAVDVEPSGGTYDFEVTISSPYDTPDRYADGWRVMSADGTVYGEHELGHDHANEQPFTRTQSGVEIPEDVDEVIVEGRDQENGYGGETVTVPLPDN